jgi:hypothetical protein
MDCFAALAMTKQVNLISSDSSVDLGRRYAAPDQCCGWAQSSALCIFLAFCMEPIEFSNG